jgi:hypothetical protein
MSRGPLGQCARERHTLLLAARKFVRASHQHGGVQRDHVHQFGNAFGAPGRVARQAEADVPFNREVRKQRAVLRHVADAALVRGHGVGAVGQLPAAQRDAAGVGRFKARDDAQQRGLARARGADDGGAAARRDTQVHAAQRLDGAVVFADGLQFQGGRHRVIVPPCVWIVGRAARSWAARAAP